MTRQRFSNVVASFVPNRLRGAYLRLPGWIRSAFSNAAFWPLFWLAVFYLCALYALK